MTPREDPQAGPAGSMPANARSSAGHAAPPVPSDGRQPASTTSSTVLVPPERRPVTVIGAGIVGLCTAYHLRRLGHPVTVIDRQFEGEGASWGNAGSISPGSVLPVAYRGMLRDLPQMLLDPAGPLHITASGLRHHTPWLLSFLRHSTPTRIRSSAEAIRPLVERSLEAHFALLEAIGSEDLLRVSGQLHLYPDRQAVARDRFGWELRREMGVRLEELDREGLLALEPSVGPAYAAAVFLPDQGMIIDPGDYSGRLRAVLRQAGVKLVEDEVCTFTFDSTGVAGITPTGSRHGGGEIVLCGGAWSAKLLRRHGERIPLINQRGFHVQFLQAGVTLSRVVVLADRKIFVTPMRHGLRAAGTVEITALDRSADMRRADYLAGNVRAAWPQINPRAEFIRWSGERPCLPDSLPVMGRSMRHPRLWLNFGHGHLGLTLSAVSGEAIARAISTDSDEALPPAFNPRRFTS
jgi:glycine/D-amino acid oxidase-like deaminating enzyme